MYRNRIEVMGYLGGDPELKHTTTGRALARVSVATKDVWRDKAGERQERSQWHSVIFWGRLAELAGQLLHKGSHVSVVGSLYSREFEDREGAKRRVFEIRGDEFLLLDRAEKSEEPPQGEPPPAPDDKVPF